MKPIITCLIFVAFTSLLFSQTAPPALYGRDCYSYKDFVASNLNYGFTSSDINDNHQDANVSSKVVVSGNYLYYVGSDQRVYCMIRNSDGIWNGGDYPLVSSAPLVKANTNLIADENTVYYVRGSDSKIQELEIYSSYLASSVALQNMDPVRSGTDIILGNGASKQIFYVNNANKVCSIVFNGSSWQGGTQLSSQQSVNVRANSNLIHYPPKIYYVGDDNKLYDVVWFNEQSKWVGGNWRLGFPHPIIKPNTKITNDKNTIFYIGDNNKIYENKTFDTGREGREITVWNQTVQDVRDGSELFYLGDNQYEGNIYYIGSNNYVCWLVKINGNWQWGKQIYGSANEVKQNTQLQVGYNSFIQEGTINTIQNSHHVFYAGTSGKINYYVNDDVFQCFGKDSTNCDNLPNQTEWHWGRLRDRQETYLNNGSSSLAISDMDLFYVNTNQKLSLMTRNPRNQIAKTGWDLTFNDEFDNNLTDFTSWGYQWPYSNGNGKRFKPPGPNAGKDKSLAFYNVNEDTGVPNNITESNGRAVIETRLETVQAIEWRGEGAGGYNDTYPDCETRLYDYTTGTLNSGGVNIDIFNIPDPLPTSHQYLKLNSCGPDAKQPTLEQKHGYFEIRCKAPRGKDMWAAFWLLTNRKFTNPNDPCTPKHNWVHYPPEVDIFEIEGHGKIMLNNNIWKKYKSLSTDPNCCTEDEKCKEEVNGIEGHAEYAIGYRFTDDFHTYALNWTPNKMEFLLNNEVIHSVTDNIPFVEMYMLISNVVTGQDANKVAICEPEVSALPAVQYEIDYVRVYEETQGLGRLRKSDNETEEVKVSIVPNPNNGEFLISQSGGELNFIYEIYDLRGRLVTQGRSENLVANIKLEQQGVYVVKVISELGIIETQKVVVN